MKKILDNFNNLFFVDIFDTDDNSVHSGIYTGTIEEIKTELSSVYGGNNFVMEISRCVVDELPCFEDVI